MNIKLDCYPCMVNLAIRTARMVGLDESQAVRIADWTMQSLINKSFSHGPPGLTASLYEHMHTYYQPETPVFDPYKNVKAQTNAAALALVPRLYDLVENSADRLAMAVQIAAAGNIIDFGAVAHEKVDIKSEIALIEQLRFRHYDYALFRNKNVEAGTVLYLADNAGEIVFDAVLMHELKRFNPSVDITVALRDRPILNDVTLADLEGVAEMIPARLCSSGSRYPGTVLAEASSALQNLFRTADVVIAKGQGNYETLCDDPREGLFFVMRVKCAQVARDIQAGVGDLVLYHMPG